MTTKPNLIFKLILGSVFFYFVAMMLVLGNGSSFLGRYIGSYFAPVANMVGLNTTWNFFSPDPAHTMLLKYVIHYEDAYGNPVKEAIENYFPPESELTDFRLHKRRLSYVMRFFAASPNRMEQYFIPWLCKTHPGASRVQTEISLSRIPPLDVAYTMTDTDYSELVKQEEVNPRVYSCNNLSE